MEDSASNTVDYGSFDDRALEQEKAKQAKRMKQRTVSSTDGDLDEEDEEDDEDEDESDLAEDLASAAALNDSNQLIIGSIAERVGVSVEDGDDSSGQILSAGNLLSNIAIASGGQPPLVVIGSPASAKSTNRLQIPISPSPLPPQPIDESQITVSWRDLTYTVEQSSVSVANLFGLSDDDGDGSGGQSKGALVRRSKRTILKGVNGHFSTGRLTAVMGPSGSGKSTMLECIVGFRKRGLTGDIRVASGKGSGSGSKGDVIKMALISQSDYLIESFTVREMLVYASRLKNFRKEDEEEAKLMKVVVEGGNGGGGAEGGGKGSDSKRNLLEDGEDGGGGGGKEVKNVHQKLAINVCNQLGLDVCIDTRAGSCSGGQKKRISIALEMISK